MPRKRPPEPDDDDTPPPSKKWKRIRLLAMVALAGGALVATPFALRRMSYFRVRKVEIDGARYVQPKSLLDALALDSAVTIWESLGPLEDRLRSHPQVKSVSISRRLPGTLVLHIVENLPVALLSTNDGLRAIDRDAHPLPIDPSKTAIDLPIVARSDTAVLRMLDGTRLLHPTLFSRISEVRWDEHGGLRVILSGMTVRASRDCSADRFAEILPVEQDLVRRGRRATELDLRYRDQIVARIE